MKVYVSIDLEGVAGVVHVDQTRRTGHDYEQARRWMTGEANAAVAGAFEAGAEGCVVNDAHGDMRNLVLDELDPRAEVVTGHLKPLSMVAGADGGFGVALFVGYHAGAGSRRGVLDHTYDGRVITRVRVNEEEWDEAAINAAVLGLQGVPVGLVTGDSLVCERAAKRFGAVETVAVKDALGRYAARTRLPKKARELVREGARRAVARARVGAFAPFRPEPRFELRVSLANAGCADAAEMLPGSRRTSGVTLAYTADDAEVLLRVVRCWATLGAAALV
jgi:D-amino peptidase